MGAQPRVIAIHGGGMPGVKSDAAHAGGTQPAVMNAANEVAVGAFLQKKAAFLDIPKTIEKVMRQCGVSPIKDLETVLAADAEARVKAREFLKL